jgi:hypothetical protein
VKRIDRAYKDLRRRQEENSIFWNFIQHERNNVLKVYRFAAKENTIRTPGTGHVNQTTGEQWQSPSEPTAYDQYIEGGPFDGAAS